jgi:hypothetical protein
MTIVAMEAVMAIPIASLPVAMIVVPTSLVAAIVVATIVVAAVIVTALVVTTVVTIVATLITVAVAIVGLRSRGDGADQRHGQSSSSDQTFHFDLPDSPANRLGAHYRPGRLIAD